MIELVQLFKPGSHDDPQKNFGLEKHLHKGRDCMLFMGSAQYDGMDGGHIRDYEMTKKEKIAMTFEEPNFCTWSDAPWDGQHIKSFKYVDKVFTIDPYVAEVFDNRTCIPFMVDVETIPAITKKDIDLIYAGRMGFGYVKELCDFYKNYNHAIVSVDGGTHTNISHAEKLGLYARSKIAVVHNLLWPNAGDVPRYKQFPNAEKIESFKHLDQGVMPQIKYRVFEAAYCRTLIFCKRDQWNVIERYYTPDKHFVYFDDFDDLKEKVDYALNNYLKFYDMIENAFYHTVDNYTTEKFVKRFLS